MTKELVIDDVALRNEYTVLAGNEIELGMVILTIESRASKISRDKGNGILDIMVQIDKDLR